MADKWKWKWIFDNLLLLVSLFIWRVNSMTPPRPPTTKCSSIGGWWSRIGGWRSSIGRCSSIWRWRSSIGRCSSNGSIACDPWPNHLLKAVHDWRKHGITIRNGGVIIIIIGQITLSQIKFSLTDCFHVTFQCLLKWSSVSGPSPRCCAGSPYFGRQAKVRSDVRFANDE